MEVTVFKTIRYETKKINAVAQSSKFLAVVHSCCISIYTIQNFRFLVSFDILHDCSIAKFVNEQIVVLVSQNKIIFLDIHKNITKEYEHECKIKLIETQSEIQSKIQNEIVFVNTRNQIYKLESAMKDNDMCMFEINMVDSLQTLLILNEKDEITSIRLCGDNIVYTNNAGYVKISSKSKSLVEYYCSNKQINKICDMDNKLIMITNDGSLLVFDIKNGVMLDDIQVRETPLYGLGLIDNNIFCAGEDNRLINYELMNNKLCRKNQTDTHNAPVFDIFTNNNRIITISKDNTMAVHELRNQGFCFRKILLNNDDLKTAHDKFLVKNNKKITIYRIDDKINRDDACFYDEHDYTCLYELQSDKNIQSFDINSEGTYLAYSTSQKTTVIHLYEAKYKTLLTREAAYQICFYSNYFCYVNMQKKLIIVNIKENVEVFSMFLCDYEDKIQTGNDCILLTKTKAIINDKMETKKINIKEYIEKAVFADSNIYLLTQNQEYNVNTNYKIVRYDMKTQETKIIADLHSILRTDYFMMHAGMLISSDCNNLFITNIETGLTTKKSFGDIILGTALLNKNLLIYQIEKEEYYKDCISNKHLKIKWSKKLANK
ncbi:hypothetical protein BDAP_001782 [Binucleata daphniae]